MSKVHEELSPEIERQLDLLVNGELGEAERRQLLASFDERPGALAALRLCFSRAELAARGSGL